MSNFNRDFEKILRFLKLDNVGNNALKSGLIGVYPLLRFHWSHRSPPCSFARTRQI